MGDQYLIRITSKNDRGWALVVVLGANISQTYRKTYVKLAWFSKVGGDQLLKSPWIFHSYLGHARFSLDLGFWKKASALATFDLILF